MGIVVIGLALALGSGGSRQPIAAKALGAKGAQEYAAGRYEDAARDLQAAFDLFPAPILLFNLGQCERAQGHLVQAIDFYRRYLEAAPNAPNASAARRKLQEALEAKARPVPGVGRPPSRSDLTPDAVETLPAEPPMVPPPARASSPAIAPSPPAPAAAVSATPPPAGGSHWLGASLLTAAVVGAGFAIYGVVKVIQYDQIQTAQSWSQYGAALEQQENAQNWEYAAIGLGVAAAGGAVGAGFAW